MEDAQEVWLSVTEAAAQAHMHTNTLRKHVVKKRLKSVKIRGLYFIRQDWLDYFMSHRLPRGRPRKYPIRVPQTVGEEVAS